jgi:hypothetical protein
VTNSWRVLAVRGRWAAVAACLAVVGTGCGGPATASVAGKITYKGQPFESGSVAVRSEADGTMTRSPIAADGSYRIENAPVGKVKILVTASPKRRAGPRAGDEDGKAGVPPAAREIGGIPLKYADPTTSPYAMDLKPGANEFSADLN